MRRAVGRKTTNDNHLQRALVLSILRAFTVVRFPHI